MKRVQACLIAREDRESNCGGPVWVALACLCAGKTL